MTAHVTGLDPVGGVLGITGASLWSGTARFTGRSIHIALPTTTARFTGQTLLRAALRPRGNPVRVYRVRITAGSETYTLVPTNWQGRYAADRANYLGVSIHNPPDDVLNAIAAAAEAEDTLTLTLESGFRWPAGDTYYADLYTVNLQVLTDSIGPTSRSARMEGYIETPALTPKAVTISKTETLRTGSVATGWRGVLDDRVDPGDLVTVADRPGLQFVAGNITYNVNATEASMDINELTDAEILETLPW